MSKTNKEIIEKVVFMMRDWVKENNYATLYPNRDNLAILIDDPVKTKEEHEGLLYKLQECGIIIISDNILKEGRHITAIDDINGDYRKVKNVVSKEVDKN